MSVRVLQPPADIFAASADAIVIPTNALGTMGAGLALAAAKRWPAACDVYRRACRDRLVDPGDAVVHLAGGTAGAVSVVIFVATKDDWRNDSRIEWVEEGLRQIVEWALVDRPKRLAVPALGCGFGSLSWADVEPLMMRALSALPDEMDVVVFAPHEREPRRQRRQKGRRR